METNNPIISYLVRNKLIDEFMNYSMYMYYVAGISFFNSAVLMVQRPGVGFVATENTWRKYGRIIKPGAAPLIVLRPFGPLELYYETCDTYSPNDIPLPKWIITVNSEAPPCPENEFNINCDDVIRMLNIHGIYYAEREMGELVGGVMEFYNDPVLIHIENKNGEVKFIETHYAMVVNSKKSSQEKAAVIFHEIGHLLCGHLPHDNYLKRHYEWVKLSIPKRGYENLSHEQKEFEAETTCELIMRGLGYKYDRLKYLRGYMIDGHEPEYDLGLSVAAADQFLSWIRNDKYLKYIKL